MGKLKEYLMTMEEINPEENQEPIPTHLQKTKRYEFGDIVIEMNESTKVPDKYNKFLKQEYDVDVDENGPFMVSVE